MEASSKSSSSPLGHGFGWFLWAGKVRKNPLTWGWCVSWASIGQFFFTIGIMSQQDMAPIGVNFLHGGIVLKIMSYTQLLLAVMFALVGGHVSQRMLVCPDVLVFHGYPLIE
jgi:hypothetical protein